MIPVFSSIEIFFPERLSEEETSPWYEGMVDDLIKFFFSENVEIIVSLGRINQADSRLAKDKR